MKNCLILDRAHGINVGGKCAPDKSFYEWQWSQLFNSHIYDVLSSMKLGFDIYAPTLNSDKEPGLSNRVRMYNKIAKGYDNTIMISAHVNAYGEGWTTASGFSFFTSRGETKADEYATLIGNIYHQCLPDEKMRFDFGLSRGEHKRDLDKEANFTVLFGSKIVKPNYEGILIEHGFMNNKQDLAKLKTDVFNRKLEDALITSILKIFNGLGDVNLLDEIIIK